jgi:hypothetical protein
MTTDTTAVTTTPSNDGGEPTTTEAPVTPTTDATTAPPTEPTATAPQAPESYEFAMPEGVQLDKAAAEEFSAIAKELKLDQATAQKVADVGAKMAQRQAEAHAELVESWVEAVKSDKDIGGDKLTENLGVARKALESFGTPELKDVLDATGFGNHPEIIKAFYKIGKAISDDRFVTGNAKGPDTDIARKMFPSMN